MKYHHLILTLAVSLALPMIAPAKEKGTGASSDVEATVKKIEQEKSGTLKLESSNLSDIKVQVSDPDMAVVVYRSNDKGTYKGKDVTGEYRWLDVFVKRGGKWQIAIDQGTQIAKQ